MMRAYIPAVFILTLLSGGQAAAEVFMDAGTMYSIINRPVSAVSENALSLDVGGEVSGYYLASDTVSFFYSGSGDISYSLSDSHFSAFLSTTADGSYRRGIFLSRLTLESSLEWDEVPSAPQGSAAAELFFSLSSFTSSVYFSGRSGFTGGEQKYAAFPLTLGVSHTFLLELLATAELSLEPVLNFSDSDDFLIDSSLAVSWYPGLPLTIDAEAGFRRNASSRTGELLGETFPLYSYREIYGSFSLTSRISDGISITPAFSGSFRGTDYPAVSTDTVGFSSLLSENEWEAALSPSLELRWDVSHSTAMLLNGGWTKVLSNSGYRRESNLTLSAQAILTLP